MQRRSTNWPCRHCDTLTGNKTGLCVKCRTKHCLHCKKLFVQSGNKTFSHCSTCRKSKKIMNNLAMGMIDAGDF